MKIFFDCYPCILRQALNAARRSHADRQQIADVLHKALKVLDGLPVNSTPPEVGLAVHQLVRQVTGVYDPYRQAKIQNTQQALALYPRLKELVRQSSQPLDTAIRLSIAGNIIDLGVKDVTGDLWQTVERVLHEPYAIDDTKIFIEKMKDASYILFISDNAGETVFDRVLVEEIKIPVIYAVKSEPVINDATIEDARAAGIDNCAKIIRNGNAAPGTVLSLCSAEFLALYQDASVVIAKGQGNYESLSDAGEKVFCLLQAKCPVIAQDLHTAVGGIIARQSISNPDDSIYGNCQGEISPY